MCEPATAAIVTGVTAVTQATAATISQAKAAKAQTRAITTQRQLVREETRQAATGELFDQMRASRREQGRIRAAAGEAGLSVNSANVSGLLRDSAMQLELQSGLTLANMESRHRATEADAASMLSRVQQPTAFGAGLQIAAAGTSAWAGIEGAKLRKRKL